MTGTNWMYLIAFITGLLLVVFLAGLALSAPRLPYVTLQDIPQEHIVASTTMSCAEGPVLSLALHDPETGYWMLWITSKAWAMASFGMTEPMEGTLAKVVIQGVWKEEQETRQFVVAKMIEPSTDKNTNYRVFCNWLYPKGA